jgi:hypothetical protein
MLFAVLPVCAAAMCAPQVAEVHEQLAGLRRELAASTRQLATATAQSEAGRAEAQAKVAAARQAAAERGQRVEELEAQVGAWRLGWLGSRQLAAAGAPGWGGGGG